MGFHTQTLWFCLIKTKQKHTNLTDGLTFPSNTILLIPKQSLRKLAFRQSDLVPPLFCHTLVTRVHHCYNVGTFHLANITSKFHGGPAIFLIQVCFLFHFQTWVECFHQFATKMCIQIIRKKFCTFVSICIYGFCISS